MCFRLQIHSQWMMKTHWRAQSQRTRSVRRSDTRTPRTKQVDSGQESLRINIQKHCIHRRATTWVRIQEQCRKAQHSTGQSTRTIPSFSACIPVRTLKQRISRQDWLAASPMSSENVLVPNKLCRCQNLYCTLYFCQVLCCLCFYIVLTFRGGATIGSGWYISPHFQKLGGYKGVQVGSTGVYRLLLFVA